MKQQALQFLEHSPYFRWLPEEHYLSFIIGVPIFFVLIMVLLITFTLKAQKPTGDQNFKPKDTTTDPKEDDWAERLFLGLGKTRDQLTNNIASLFKGKKIDSELLEKLHELLFKADIGPTTADYLTDLVEKNFGTSSSAPEWGEVRAFLSKEIEIILTPERNTVVPPNGPQVVLVVGVNGVGKTTSIGKLAASYLSDNKRVLLCAADTFRAAAIDQLKVWADRLGIEVIYHKQGSDPAAVAFDSVKAAVSRDADLLLIDTAGRLHNKKDLMEELHKIKRVICKDLPEAPHETWLVVDATSGQNVFQQIRSFNEVVNITGLVVTKLDGTAKGGVIIGAAKEFGLPIRYIGVGEKAEDLRAFSPKDFAASLFPKENI